MTDDFSGQLDTLLTEIDQASNHWARLHPDLLTYPLEPCTQSLLALLTGYFRDCQSEAQSLGAENLDDVFTATPPMLEAVARAAFFLGYHYSAKNLMPKTNESDIGRTPIGSLIPPSASEKLIILNRHLVRTLVPLMSMWSKTTAGKAKPQATARDELYDAIIACTGPSFLEGAWEASLAYPAT